MLILGNKYKLSKKERELLQSKFNKIHEIDIANSTTDNIIKTINLFIENENTTQIVLNLEKKISLELESYLENLDYSGVNFLSYSDFSAAFLNSYHAELNDNNVKVLQDIKHDNGKILRKRIFDILFSLHILVLLSPVFVLISILIKLISPNGPIFFTQQRIGKDGKFFRVYKFRTMVSNAEAELEKLFNENPCIKEKFFKDFKLDNDPRIIKYIGNFMRKSSLDELPQFFNSLLGNMSVVGPRPALIDEIAKIRSYNNGSYAVLLFSVNPGITGLWQISGRSNISYDDRVDFNMAYIKNISFMNDLTIILKTIYVVLLRRGAN